MKKAMLILGTSAMMAALAGCGNGKSAQETSAAATAAETEVKESDTQAAETSSSQTSASWMPEKDIHVIIPFNAGGSSDVACRVLVDYLNKYSDVDFVVENLPGSGGQVGMEAAADADPDGYTIGSIPSGWFMSYAMENVDKTYTEYTPITTWADSYMALVVNKSSGWENYEEFVNAAKEKQLLIGGVSGTLPSLAEYVMADKEGFEFIFTDMEEKSKQTELLSNRVDAYVDAFASIQQYIESGDFNCLALFSNEKPHGYENIPSMKELGYELDPDFLAQRYSFWGPKGMDEGAVEYINQVVKQASEDPECQKAMQEMFYNTSWMSVSDYQAYCEKVQNDTVKYVNDLFFE